MELLIGTYTRGTGSNGIYRCDFDNHSGTFSPPGLLIDCVNPSWVSRWQNGLIAVNEHDGAHGTNEGEVSVFQFNGAGIETVQQVGSGGADPCHLALQGDRLAVANYSGGTVALFEWAADRIGRQITLFQPERRGPHPRQASAHPHGAYFRDGALWVPDLGGDCIYRLDPVDGALLGRIDLPSGSGPRHLSPDGAFVVNELGNTVTAIEGGPTGDGISTLPAGFTGESSTAEIQALGDLLYVSNRGHDSIAVLATRPALAVRQHRASGGRHPRHFLISPRERYLLAANRDSNNLVSIRIAADGSLGDIVSETSCPAPVHLLF